MIFLNSASSAAALVFYLSGVCTHTDTERKQGKARVQNILKSAKKTQYLMNALYMNTYECYEIHVYDTPLIGLRHRDSSGVTLRFILLSRQVKGIIITKMVIMIITVLLIILKNF